MNFSVAIPLAVMLFCGTPAVCAQWDCDDWVARRGYCVDYVKARIPTFPVPESEADMGRLNNREVRNIAAGDVAVFDLGRYWHVAYVECVHRDRRGTPIAIDVSEHNFGARMTADHYRRMWGGQKYEWERAVWCGVTKNYGQRSVRSNVPIGTVQQVWSPAPHRRPGQGGGSVYRALRFLQGMLGLSGRDS